MATALEHNGYHRDETGIATIDIPLPPARGAYAITEL